MKRQYLKIENNLNELTTLRSTLEHFFHQQHLTSELAGEMLLVAEEIVVNTISYGYSDSGEHRIDFEFSRDKKNVFMKIIDDAQPFNPFNQNEHTLRKCSKQARVGGLGIALIKALSDKQHYQYKDGRNIIEISRSINC